MRSCFSCFLHNAMSSPMDRDIEKEVNNVKCTLDKLFMMLCGVLGDRDSCHLICDRFINETNTLT